MAIALRPNVSARLTGRSLAMALVLLLASASAQAQTQLNWLGDYATANSYMADLAALWESSGEGSVVLRIGTATEAMAQVAGDNVDMGGSSRAARTLDRTERRVAMYPVVWDALVAVTHRDNQIRNINLDQLKGIYTGSISNWSQLGGDDQPINMMIHADDLEGIDYNIRQLLFADPQRTLVNSRQLPNTQLLIEAVSADPNSIAVTTYSSARRQPLNILMFENVAANYTAIAEGDYLLYIPLYVAIRENSSKRREVRDFLRFAAGPQAKRVLRRNGVVPYTEGLTLVSKQLERDDFLQRNIAASQ